MKRFIAFVALLLVVVAGCTSTPPRTHHGAEFPYPQALTAGATTETSIEFTWDPVPDAPRYRVRLSKNADMSNSVYQRSTGNSTIEKFEGLTNNTTYYAKVRVITEDGQDLSPYSPAISARTFTTVEPSPAPTDPAPPSADDNKITKVLSFWFENKSYRQVERGMANLLGISKKYGYFKLSWKATGHPSNPNYIDAAFGSNFGVFVNRDATSAGRYNKPTVFGEAIKHGQTAKVYAQKAPFNCPTKSYSPYESRHDPWPHSSNTYERSQCKKFHVPFKTNFITDVRNGNLPDVGMVIPDDCNNAHDCSIGTADRWLATRLTDLMNGPDWKSGHLLINVVFDEDDKQSGNIVWSAMLHPGLHGKVSTESMNHNSLTLMWNKVGNTPPMLGAATAHDPVKAMGLEYGLTPH